MKLEIIKNGAKKLLEDNNLQKIGLIAAAIIGCIVLSEKNIDIVNEVEDIVEPVDEILDSSDIIPE